MCILLSPPLLAAELSQDTKLSLNITNESIKDVLHKIEDKTEFRFIYESGSVNLDKKISINVSNQPIKVILDQIFSKENINYIITEKHLILINPATADKTDNSAVAKSDIFVSGTVFDESGEAAIGVSVMLKGTTTGTVTNIDGHYRIPVSGKNDVLRFAFLGYKTEEVKVGNQTTLNIHLKENLKELDELVVIGYGAMKKIDLTGAVVSANIQAFRESSNVSILQSLQGSVAGLNVGQVREAGQEPSMMIRGQNSFSSDQAPLIVVDGIIYNAGLNNINPADVKSIDILKDASSASIYGSRAANGVILISTFSGEANEGKPILNYSTSYAFQTPSHRLKPLNREGLIARATDAVWDRAYTAESGYTERDPAFDIATVFNPENRIGYDNGTDFDWWDAATNDYGHTMNHHVSISGKSAYSTYYISTGFTEQEGYIKEDQYTRWTGKINLENKITNWLKIGVQTNMATGNYDGMPARMDDVMRMTPFSVPYDEKGEVIRLPMGQNVRNPLEPYLDDDYNRKMNIFGNVYANIDVPYVKGLSYRVNYSHSYSSERKFRVEPWEMTYTGKAEKYNGSDYTWSLDNILTYDKTFNNIHKIQATLVSGREEAMGESSTAGNSAFTNLDLGYNKLEAGSIPKVSSNAWDETSLYYMARAHYAYKGKYLGTFTVRRDGFSGFGANRKFAVFPSAAAAWVVSEEQFMQNNPLAIDFLKLRASYGETGRRTVGRYATLAQVTSEVDRDHAYIYGDNGSMVVGQKISSMANDDLRWETTTGLNLGLDFSIINNRIRGNVEYYNTATTNIIYNRSLPYLTGITSDPSVKSNIGKINNHGIEFTINSTNIKTKDFVWDMSLNFSRNRNTIVSINGVDADGDGKEDDVIADALFIGKPLNAIYGYNILGIYQLNDPDIPSGKRPGQYIIENIDGDEIGLITANDRKILGYKDPSYRFSIGNTFKYKKLSLFVFLNSIQGGKEYYMAANDPGAAATGEATVNSGGFSWDYWTPSNPNAKYAQLYYATPVANSKYQQRSFVRLQDVSLSYQFDKSILDKIGFHDLKVYISGKNLYTWTNWEGWDPETGQGMTGNGTPVLRAFTVGFDVSF